MPLTKKRARGYGPQRPAKRFRSPARMLPVSRQKGFLRTGGFYGRFEGRGGEQKFLDTSLNDLVNATAEVPATGGQLCLIPQGVTESERVGRKCTLKSIYVKGRMLLQPAAGTANAAAISMWLVQDTQANGAAAAVTDVLTASNVNAALNNLSNSSRFRILAHKQWVLTPKAGVEGAFNDDVKWFKIYKKVNIPLEFSSTTGAITELRSNNVFMIWGSTGGGADDTVGIAGTSRIRFSDN